MTAIRDQIGDAVIALLQANLSSAQFPTISREFVTWEQMLQNIQAGDSPTPQPALFYYGGIGFGGGVEKVEQRGRASPSVSTIYRSLVCYARLPGAGSPAGVTPGTVGEQVFNPLYEAIAGVFATPDSVSQNALTLGGLVSHCWIEGDVVYVTPDVDPSGQGMFTVPLSIMMLPNSR